MKPAAGRFDNSVFLPLFVSLGLMICSILFQHGGVLNWEVELRLPYYLSHGSLAGKIYDSDYLDAGMYQARELSYFFDYLDCRFIALCVALGMPHFLSLTQYVFLLVISLELWRFGVGDLKLNPWLVLGVLGLFWTAPDVFWGGTFFRTAKIGVALAVVVLYRIIFRVLHAGMDKAEYQPSTRTWLACFGWAWAATLFDRQGVFLIATALVFLAACYLESRQKNILKLTAVFAAAFALSLLYNYIIAPLLTMWINGYWPDFKYQHLPWAELAARPLFFANSAWLLYLDTFRFLVGNLPTWAAAFVLIGIICLPWINRARRRQTTPSSTSVTAFILTQTVFVWVMILLMLLRHGALLWPDVRRVYYFLPLTSMFAMTLLLALSSLRAWRISSDGCLALFLCATIVGNIFALPRHRAILTGGKGKEASDATPALLAALRNVHNPQYAVSPEIAGNRVYQFFHDGHFVKQPFHPSGMGRKPK